MKKLTNNKIKLTKPHYIIGEDFIVVTHKGKPHIIYNGDARFTNLKNIIIAANWSQLEVALSLAKTIEKYSFGKVKVFDESIFYDDKPIHNAITKRIFEFITNNYPFEHLVKFMDKIMLNPSERSREQLLHYLDLYKLPIDENGDFLAYKAVTNDFKDNYTRTIDNSIGKIVKVSRCSVSDDPNSPCSFGLHLGNWQFVHKFLNDSSKIIILRVNPMNVVSIPHDANSQKMRVCEYEVVKLAGEPKETTDFSSNYVKDNSSTKDIITKSENELNYISLDSAYKIHKSQDKVLMGLSKKNGLPLIAKYKDNKSRSFFRSGYRWEIATNTEVLSDNSMALAGNTIKTNKTNKNNKPQTIPKHGIKVGSNRAYELHRQGANLKSLTLNTVTKKSENLPRSFFRNYSDWFQI
jgi:hypothetical protein